MLYYKPPKKVPIPVLKIDNTEITSVDTVNFLGLLLNKKNKLETSCKQNNRKNVKSYCSYK